MAGSVTPGAQLGTPTTAPGGLAGLAATGTPTPRLEEGPLPAPAEDSQAGDQSRSSEPGLGARGSSWGHATAPSLQLVQTGLGRVRPWQAACQASGVLPAPGSPQELGTGGRALGHSQAPPSRQEIVPQSVPFVGKTMDVASHGGPWVTPAARGSPRIGVLLTLWRASEEPAGLLRGRCLELLRDADSESWGRAPGICIFSKMFLRHNHTFRGKKKPDSKMTVG